MELAEFPLLDSHAIRGTARSKTCGSTIELGCALSADRQITALGLGVQACAIGQAAAAIFAARAIGQDRAEIAGDLAALENWLGEPESSSFMPRLELLEPAREHPTRHGAILLPWQAALNALCS